MPKLHEVLAVESGLSTVAANLSKETIKTFGKENLFTGELKKHQVFDEDKQHLVQPTTERKVETTVTENLKYLFDSGLSPYWDSIIQKDSANQSAKADIIIDGKVIAKDVPGVTLLGLESKLAVVFDIFNAIPTLAPGIEWVQDENQKPGVMVNTQKEERLQSVTETDWKVIAEATEHHRAQLKEIASKVDIGKFTVTSYSGMVSPVQKAGILTRLQTLINAVKKARQRANCQEVPKVSIGKALADYLINE